MTFMRSKPTSLRAKLLFLVLLAILPATVAHFADKVDRYRQAYKAEIARLDQVAQVVASHESTLVDSASHLLAMSLDLARLAIDDPAACDAKMRELHVNLPAYANLVVDSAQGEMRCGAIRTGPVDYADRDYFKEAIASNGAVSSNLIYSRTTGKPSIAFARAARSGGILHGVVVATLEVSNFTAIVRDVPLPRDAALAIVDRTGALLARRPAENIAVGTRIPGLRDMLDKAGSGAVMAELTGLDGVERLVALAPVRGPDGTPAFHVLLGSAKSALTREFVRSVLVDLAVFGTVILVSLFGAWRLGINLVLRPLGVLTAAIGKVTEGQAGARTGLDYGRTGEIGELARHFDDMSAVLQRRETEARQSQQRIEQLALYDHVSGLPNRALLMQGLAERLGGADAGCVLMVVNLDRFNALNQTLERAEGDAVLHDVGRRIAALAASGDIVAHLGGDEFVLVAAAPGPHEPVGIARRILRGIHEPMVIRGRPFELSARIGIATTGDTRDPATLLRYAGTAMRRAKNGPRQIEFFNRADDTAALEGWTLESDLARALERDELFLLYQPKTDLASGRIVGVEALIRWRHPERGVIPPAAFIPIAERSRLIVPIGAWVIEEACRQGARWIRSGILLNMAVNVSAEQLVHGSLDATVDAALQATAFPAALLELEITEGVLLRDVGDALARLRTLGVKLSLDDFGTGFSSLSYLKRLQLDRLKVDQSFIRHIDTSPGDRAVTEAIVSVARAFSLEVVAEGIETRHAENVLKAMGCHQGQGYLYAPPLPVEALEALVAAQPGAAGANAPA